MNQFVTAARVHTALTAEPEKRLLTWMAQRTPRAIGPDHLTALALASQILAGVAYALASHDRNFLWLVGACLALNWLGDSLDGTLARIRNQQRPRYGFYVDHIADTFGALALMAGLGCSGYLHWPIATGMLVCFYARSPLKVILATYTMGALSSFTRSVRPHRNSNSVDRRKRGRSRPSQCEFRGPHIPAIRFRGRGRDRRNDRDGLGRRCPPYGVVVPAGSSERVTAPYGHGSPNPKHAVWQVQSRWTVRSRVATASAFLADRQTFHMPTVAATAIAVEDREVLHNFMWHERFTWPDRRVERQTARRLVRFHAGNGVVSLFGNTILMYCLVDRLKVSVALSAVVAILVCSFANFLIADRWVYRPRAYIRIRER